MDMASESTHPMVLKGIKTNRQPRLDLQTSKVKASMNTRRRLSTLTRAFLLKWLELEFSSLVSSFTGTISSFVLCSNDDLMVRILPSILIGLTLAVTSDFVTLFVVIVFHREFHHKGFSIPHSIWLVNNVETFEGLGVGSRLAYLNLPPKYYWIPIVGALLYGITTPIGIAIGLGVRTSYNPDSTTPSIVSGILDSLSAGVLIYTGLVEVSKLPFFARACGTFWLIILFCISFSYSPTSFCLTKRWCLHHMVKSPMPLLRCCLVVELWHFWGDGHDCIIIQVLTTSWNSCSIFFMDCTHLDIQCTSHFLLLVRIPVSNPTAIPKKEKLARYWHISLGSMDQSTARISQNCHDFKFHWHISTPIDWSPIPIQFSPL